MAKKLRKYQALWMTLKQELVVEVIIDHWQSYTKAQLERQFYTLRRSLSKEKYMDWDYKRTNPNAEVEVTGNHTNGTITFTLDPDRKDLSKYF